DKPVIQLNNICDYIIKTGTEHYDPCGNKITYDDGFPNWYTTIYGPPKQGGALSANKEFYRYYDEGDWHLRTN
ncbi:MAG: hypothetical protein ACOC6D_05395, partial [Atribacterota bacterium]